MWGGKTKKTCNRCSESTRKQNERNVLAPARALTASSAERGMPLLDLVRTEEEKKLIVAKIFSSDAFRALRPEDSVIIFGLSRVRFPDDYAKAESFAWSELSGSFAERGDGNEPVVRIRRRDSFEIIGIPELKAAGHLQLLTMGDRVDELTGPAQRGKMEGLIIKAVIDAGTALAEKGGGRLLNKSENARGCRVVTPDGAPIRGVWGMVWMYVVDGGWEGKGGKDADWVLMRRGELFATREETPRGILRVPSAARSAGGAAASSSAGGSTAAHIGVSESGDCWRVRNETSAQMYARGQAIRAAWEPIARDRLLPSVPAAFAGVRELAVRGDIGLVTDNRTLWRAVSHDEAMLVRKAIDEGAELPVLFAREGPPLSAAQWVGEIVRHVERGSGERTRCASFTAGISGDAVRAASGIAVRFSESAVAGGTPGRMVVAIDAEDLLVAGVLDGCKLLKREAGERVAGFARELQEVVLLSDVGTNAYSVVYDKGVVTGYMGPESEETAWNGKVRGAVFCTTGVGMALSADQKAVIKRLGGSFVPTPTPTMTVLFSLLKGVSDTKKTKDAKKRGLPIISMATLNKALGLEAAASASASTVVSEGEEASTAAPKAAKRARKA
jgi:hypothetical protein